MIDDRNTFRCHFCRGTNFRPVDAQVSGVSAFETVLAG